MPLSVDTGGGDYAGRDIYKNTYSRSVVPVGRLRRLFERFEKEKQNDSTYDSISQELQHLMTQREGEIVIGLEKKLELANKPKELIEWASEQKENYSKRLFKLQFYESFQQINLILLSTARTQFMVHVYPIIAREGSDEEVSYALDEYVIKYLSSMLDEDDNFVFGPGDEWGIIYFLTGNCYIKWV